MARREELVPWTSAVVCARVVGFALALSGAGCGASGGASRPATESAALVRASVALEQDFGMVYGSGICDKDSQLTQGFACFRSNGTQYHGTPLRDEGASPGGAFPATTRLLIGIDRVFYDNVALGVRGGVVLAGGGPKPDGRDAPSFLPFHGEVRATYWFGSAPFSKPGLRVGAFIAGGIAEVDTAMRVLVEEDKSRPPPVAQLINPSLQTLDAYKKAGTGFIGGGGALAFSASRSSAFFLNLKLMQLFPSDGTALAPEIGYEHGF